MEKLEDGFRLIKGTLQEAADEVEEEERGGGEDDAGKDDVADGAEDRKLLHFGEHLDVEDERPNGGGDADDQDEEEGGYLGRGEDLGLGEVGEERCAEVEREKKPERNVGQERNARPGIRCTDLAKVGLPFEPFAGEGNDPSPNAKKEVAPEWTEKSCENQNADQRKGKAKHQRLKRIEQAGKAVDGCKPPERSVGVFGNHMPNRETRRKPS